MAECPLQGQEKVGGRESRCEISGGQKAEIGGHGVEMGEEVCNEELSEIE